MGTESGKKEMLRELIEALHAGESPDELKQRFKDVLKDVGPADVVRMEEQLIAEGMPREEIQRLCSLHLAVFKESFEREQTSAPAGHPIHTLMQEHDLLLQSVGELKNIAQAMRAAGKPGYVATEAEQIGHIEEHLRESESHYVREENVLFPYLEKHGITQPPAIMWMEHDEIRQTKKNLYRLIDERASMTPQDFATELEDAALSLLDFLSGHFSKENNILFPIALKVIEQDEWKEIGRQFDELGYCCFTPQPVGAAAETTEAQTPELEMEGVIPFEAGSLSREQLTAILDTLPVDITFVDKDEVAAKVRGGLPGTEHEGVMYSDKVVEMTKEGEVVWEWRAWQHLDPEVDRITPQDHREEWTHANTVEELPDGDILVGFRNISTIAIIERRTGDIRWRLGPEVLAQQHYPNLLPNGNILVFDNGTHRATIPYTFSRVLEIDPATKRIVWSYQDRPLFNFYSPYESSAQRLANGNTFICEGVFGRMFEVTAEGEVVWEYINPYFGEAGLLGENNWLFRAFRYSQEDIERASGGRVSLDKTR